jgi:hypothetical protein
VKTTFDLPDRLLRRAKSLAARQGRPLRDLVAEAIDARLAGAESELADAGAARADRRAAWERWRARLVREPDGSWSNPEAIADDAYFRALDDVRGEPWTARDPFGEG